MKPVPVVVETTRINNAPARCATCQKCGSAKAAAVDHGKPSAVVKDLLSDLAADCPHAGEVGKHFVSSARPG